MILAIEFLRDALANVIASLLLIVEGVGKVDTDAAVDFSTTSSWANAFGFINDWQTLIAGALAMLPASAAAIFVWKQLNEQRVQFLQIQKRDSQKSRLRLSRNLAEISGFLDTSYSEILKQNFNVSEHSVPEKLIEDVLDAGVLSGQSNFEFFKKYTIKIQQYASLCRLYGEEKGENNLLKCFVTLAEIDIMTDQLYPFARFDTDEVYIKEIGASEIESYLMHNLRRGQDISGTNLDELKKLGRLGSCLQIQNGN